MQECEDGHVFTLLFRTSGRPTYLAYPAHLSDAREARAYLAIVAVFT